VHTEQLPALAGHHPGSQIAPGRSYCTGCWDATAVLDPDAERTDGAVADLPGRLHELAAQAQHDRLTATTDADRRHAAGRVMGLDAARSAWDAFRVHQDAVAAHIAQQQLQAQHGPACEC
jgi:hypothetical protein